ncbi:MAG: response regulator, partial [Vulcanimicrobiota bacterium]
MNSVSEKYNFEFFGQARIPIVIIDSHNQIIYSNTEFQNASGYFSEELKSFTFNILLYKNFQQLFKSQVAVSIQENSAWNGFLAFRKKDNTPFLAFCSAFSIENDNQNPVAFVSRDITQEMAQGNFPFKELPGENECMQLLNKDNRETENMMQEYQVPSRSMEKPKEEESTEEICVVSNDMEKVVTDMIPGETVDINQLISELERMGAVFINEKVNLITFPGGKLPRLPLDPDALEDVLFNLIINASEAMPDGGTLTIRTGMEEAGGEENGVTPGKYVTLQVMDSGPGMKRDILNRIFEPGFTTKGHKKNRDKGLCRVKQIVDSAGGFIKVRSKLKIGSVFKLYFPLVRKVEKNPPEIRKVEEPAEKKEKPVEKKKSKFDLPGGSEHIMVVEDDGVISKLLKKSLAMAGYNAFFASTGKEAMQHFMNGQNVPDLIIADMMLPDVDGWELALKFRKISPGIKILFTSGYVKRIGGHKLEDKTGIDFISKPFNIKDILQKIRT